MTARELYKAISGGDVAAVQLAIDIGIDVNATDWCSASPLMRAAFSRQPTIVKMLLMAGAQVNAQNLRGTTPLMLARDAASAALLLQHGAHVNVRNARSETALILAALRGDLSQLQLLIDSGAAIDAKDCEGNTALTIAGERGRDETVAILRRNGSPVGITEAAVIGDVDRLERLLAPDDLSSTELGMAMWRTASTGHSLTLNALLSRGADPDVIGPDGTTALKRAVRFGRKGNVRLLLEYGADINAQDPNGITPLMLCCLPDPADGVKIAKLLLERGARPEARDEDGRTALDWATEWPGRTQLAAVLRGGALFDGLT